jgi:hypothetical protein
MDVVLFKLCFKLHIYFVAKVLDGVQHSQDNACLTDRYRLILIKMEHFYTVPFPKCLSYIRGLGLVHLSYVTPMYSRHKGRLTELLSSEVIEEVAMHCRSLQHYKLIANPLRAAFQPHMSHLLRARYMFPTSCLQGCPDVHLQSKLLYHTLIYKISTQDYIKDTMDTTQEPKSSSQLSSRYPLITVSLVSYGHSNGMNKRRKQSPYHSTFILFQIHPGTCAR